MKAGERTRLKILNAGLKLWPDVTALTIARALKLNSHTNVLYYFQTPKELKEAVAEHAVVVGDSHVIMQLVAAKHPAVAKMTQAEKIRHFNAV